MLISGIASQSVAVPTSEQTANQKPTHVICSLSPPPPQLLCTLCTLLSLCTLVSTLPSLCAVCRWQSQQHQVTRGVFIRGWHTGTCPKIGQIPQHTPPALQHVNCKHKHVRGASSNFHLLSDGTETSSSRPVCKTWKILPGLFPNWWYSNQLIGNCKESPFEKQPQSKV